MLQGSLAYTPLHRNAYWKALLESWVLLHATLIAIQTMPGWEMFFWGFALLVCLMQIPGLPAWRAMPLVVRLAPIGVFGASLGAWFGLTGGNNVRVIALIGT